MKSHAKNRAGQYRKMALALSLVLGISPLQADTAIEPAKDSPVAALLRHAVETNLEQLPADLVKFKAHYLELLEMHRSNAHSKATHLVTNCNNDGPGSLRAAVAAAASGDTVDLSGLSGCNYINLTESIVTDVDDLKITRGEGEWQKYINGNNSIRPITHNGTGTLSLEGVSVINGRYSSTGSARGGCIYSQGNVVLGNPFIEGHTQVKDCQAIGATHAGGGGVYARGGVTLFEGAVVRGNKAISEAEEAQGGGVFANSGLGMLGGVIEGNEVRGWDASGGGALAIGINAKYATVRDNKAITLGNSGYSYAVGGGLDIWRGSSESLIQAVAISGNSVKAADASSSDALVSGSGIYFYNEDVTVNSSTIADNISEGGRTVRGALAIENAEVTIKASTISGNKVRSLSQPNERGRGAGISMDNTYINLTLQSSIVAGNHIVSISGQNLASDIGVFRPTESTSVEIAGERNFINFYNADISWASTNNDILPTTPVNLEPLRDNGGITLTMMPKANSPVINKGLDLGLNYDQRGGGYARVYGPQVDIGAVERGSIHMGIFHDHFEDE